MSKRKKLIHSKESLDKRKEKLEARRRKYNLLTKEEKNEIIKKQKERFDRKMAGDPEYAAKVREKYRLRAELNRKRKKRLGISVNKYQRDLYKANRLENAYKAKCRRYKREPNRAVFAYTRDLAEGRIGLDEYTRLIDQAMSWIDVKFSGEKNLK